MAALKDICAYRDHYAGQYHQAACTSYFHNTFSYDSAAGFPPETWWIAG